MSWGRPLSGWRREFRAMGGGGHDMAMSQNGLVWNMYLNISFHTPFHTCGTTCLFAVPYPSFHTYMDSIVQGSIKTIPIVPYLYGFNCSRFNQNATEMIRQIFWYNFVCTTIPYLFHTLWNKGSAPYPMEQEGARCSPETRGFD